MALLWATETKRERYVGIVVFDLRTCTSIKCTSNATDEEQLASEKDAGRKIEGGLLVSVCARSTHIRSLHWRRRRGFLRSGRWGRWRALSSIRSSCQRWITGCPASRTAMRRCGTDRPCTIWPIWTSTVECRVIWWIAEDVWSSGVNAVRRAELCSKCAHVTQHSVLAVVGDRCWFSMDRGGALKCGGAAEISSLRGRRVFTMGVETSI